MTKYDTSRPSHPMSATLFDVGYVGYGNDGNKWIVKSNSKGVKRWVPFMKTDHESHITPKKKSKGKLKRTPSKKSKRKSPKKSKRKSSKKSKRKSPKKSKRKSSKKSKRKSPKKSKRKSSKKSKRKSPKKSKSKSPKRSKSKSQKRIKGKPFELDRLKKMCVKYNVQTHGSKATIAERLSSLRGSYLTKKEKEGILPYLKNNKNKKLLMNSLKKQGGKRTTASRLTEDPMEIEVINNNFGNVIELENIFRKDPTELTNEDISKIGVQHPHYNLKNLMNKSYHRLCKPDMKGLENRDNRCALLLTMANIKSHIAREIAAKDSLVDAALTMAEEENE